MTVLVRKLRHLAVDLLGQLTYTEQTNGKMLKFARARNNSDLFILDYAEAYALIDISLVD